MESTVARHDVVETIDEVLNALAGYEERDASIELLELRIHVDRSRLIQGEP